MCTLNLFMTINLPCLRLLYMYTDDVLKKAMFKLMIGIIKINNLFYEKIYSSYSRPWRF